MSRGDINKAKRMGLFPCGKEAPRNGPAGSSRLAVSNFELTRSQGRAKDAEQRTGVACAVLLQVDTEDTPAASTMRKRANPPRSIRIRICLELGNLADEQPLQCPVPPSSSSVLWCRPSHTAHRVALTRSDDCREAPPLPFITLPYTDGMTTPHWRTHPGGHSSSSRRHHAGGDQRRFQYQAAHHAGDTTHLET